MSSANVQEISALNHPKNDLALLMFALPSLLRLKPNQNFENRVLKQITGSILTLCHSRASLGAFRFKS